MITVYHSIPLESGEEAFKAIFDLRNTEKVAKHRRAGGYRKVAEVPTDDLEVAWRKTNSVNESWYERRDITAFLPEGEKGIRSSMIGDIFVHDDKAHMVAIMGFTENDL